MTAKNWCFTINNYTDADIDLANQAYRDGKLSYLLYGFEVGMSGTPHMQGYLQAPSKVRITGLKKLLPRANLRIARGTATDNIRYCSKDGNIQEFGEATHQGERLALTDLHASIRDHQQTYHDILMSNPMAIHQYGRTLLQTQDFVDYLGKQRDFVPWVYWLYGPTGCGKTYTARLGADITTHYTKPLSEGDRRWWDNYTGQPVVILDDLRAGDITYNELLRICDRYPYDCSRRGRQPAGLMAHVIYITSALHPRDVYPHLQQGDKLNQLYRRIKVLHFQDGAWTQDAGPQDFNGFQQEPSPIPSSPYDPDEKQEQPWSADCDQENFHPYAAYARYEFFDNLESEYHYFFEECDQPNCHLCLRKEERICVPKPAKP